MRDADATPARTRLTCAPRLGLCALVAAAALAPAAARAQLHGSADFRYVMTWANGDLAADQFAQRYSLLYENAVSRALNYRLQFNFDEYRTSLAADGPRNVDRNFGPRIDVGLKGDNFGGSAGLYVTWNNSDFPFTGSIDSRVVTAYLNAAYNFSKLTALYGNFTRVAAVSSGPGPTSLSELLNVGFTTGAGGFRFVASTLFAHTFAGIEQFRATPSVTGSFSGTLVPEVLTLTASVGASYNWQAARTTGTAPGNTPQELYPVQGLFVKTDLPADTTATPMVSIPALVDRDLDVSAGIDLGPTGTSNNNIGVDMGRTAELNTLYVYVRDASGRPLNGAGLLSWSAWSSQDGRIWSPMSSAFTFDSTLSRYVISFPGLEARYFKVVNFGVNLTSTLVTEIVPAGPSSVGTVLQSASGTSGYVSTSLAFTPSSWVGLVYNGSVNTTVSSSFYSNVDSLNLANTFLANFTPLPNTTQSFNLTNQRTRVGGQPWMDSTSATATLDYSVRPHFSSNVSGIWSRQSFGDIWVNSLNATAQVSTRPIDTVSLAGTVGMSSYRSNLGDETTVNASANVALTLLPSLLVYGGGQLNQSISGQIVIPAGTPLTPIVLYQSYNAGVTFTPSPLLNVGARLGYVVLAGVGGGTGGFNLNWQFSPNAPLSLQVALANDVDLTTGQMQKRASVNLIWQPSRFVYLNCYYLGGFNTGMPPLHSGVFELTLRI